MNFEQWLERRYISHFMMDAIDWDRTGEHVTDYAHPCPRQIYYKLIMRRKDPTIEKRLIDESKANIFWLGKKYHEIPLSNVVFKNGRITVVNDVWEHYTVEDTDEGFKVYDDNGLYLGIWGHEFPIYDEDLNIQGRIDDLVWFDGKLYIVDKKTASYIPSEPYEQYKNQVRIYAGLLHKNVGIDADEGAILFIRKKDMVTRAFTFELGDLDKLYEWFKDRVLTIREMIEKRELPGKVEGKWCQWCDFRGLCEMDAVDVPLNMDKLYYNRPKQSTLLEVVKK